MNLIYLYDEFMRTPDNVKGQVVYIIDSDIQEGYEISEKVQFYRYQLAEQAGAEIYQGKTLDIIEEIYQNVICSLCSGGNTILAPTPYTPIYLEVSHCMKWGHCIIPGCGLKTNVVKLPCLTGNVNSTYFGRETSVLGLLSLSLRPTFPSYVFLAF